ncbi:pre-mRNA-splicing factor SYF2 [Ephemerocybe angulata]|uniref:Pre-mRNA-splicing factor SYF2 n=1 Tax=Ephemerocybe angulata TaxID=980116 RepID=A0A8H6HR49_9AGAR|nr:pre-mRNA-splicing factor SYF2 [Tulosesus angulatus]
MSVDTQEDQPAASSSKGEGPETTTNEKLKEVASEVLAEAETAIEKVAEKADEVMTAAGEFVDQMTGLEAEGDSGKDDTAPEKSRSQSSEAEGGEGSKPKVSLEERRAKMEQLRKKMAAGTRANRDSLAEEAARAKLNARELARLERQRKLAETLRIKADAEERGEDAERQKNWEYTIEENDEWEKKLARKKRRADYEFHDDAHAARRRYKKDLDQIKPDLETYNQQKAMAMGLNPSTSNALTAFSSSSSAVAITGEQQRLAHENLYRDANTLIYGDNKPSDDAIDRVVGKINKDIEKKAKFHRKRVNEAEGDITYINEHNRVFNNKIKRYYDKYTTEIRDSFERGTAL